jgi:hypothetical protein
MAIPTVVPIVVSKKPTLGAFSDSVLNVLAATVGKGRGARTSSAMRVGAGKENGVSFTEPNRRQSGASATGRSANLWAAARA